MSLWFLLFILAVILIVVQYERGKRRNIEMMKRISGILERVIEPDEKIYTLIGGVVGFKAHFKKKEGDIYATLTLLPRMSPLYMPFSLLIGRRDTLHIILIEKSGRKVEERFYVKDFSSLEEAIRKLCQHF